MSLAVLVWSTLAAAVTPPLTVVDALCAERRDLARRAPEGDLARALRVLSSCDAGEARVVFAERAPGLGPAGAGALAVGADLGQIDLVTAVLARWTPAEASAASRRLGLDCRTHEPLHDVLVRVARDAAPQEQHALVVGLAPCRTPEVGALLADLYRAAPETDLLLALAHNRGAEVLPTVVARIESLPADRADAALDLLLAVANDAEPDGPITDTRVISPLIEQLAGSWSEAVVVRARDALRGWGDDAAARRLASLAWRDRFDDGYTWPVAVEEVVSCAANDSLSLQKGGRVLVALHTGVVTDPLGGWPDEAHARIDAALVGLWALDEVLPCDGAVARSVTIGRTPVRSAADAVAEWSVWRENAAVRNRYAKRVREVEHDPVALGR